MTFTSPKNFKRGRLINNRYRPIDLLVGAGGTLLSLIILIVYLVVFNGRNIIIVAVSFIPACIGITMLVPFAIYHNLMELGKLYMIYQQCRKRWIWEGVYKYDVLEEEKND